MEDETTETITGQAEEDERKWSQMWDEWREHQEIDEADES